MPSLRNICLTTALLASLDQEHFANHGEKGPLHN